MKLANLAAAALLLIGSSSIGGCAAIQSLEAAQTAVTSPIPYQDQTVDGATLTYSALGSLVLVYVTSPHADPALKTKIKAADMVVYRDLETAQKAQDAHNNAAVAVALNHLNTDNGALRAALQLAGVTVQ